MLWRTAVDFARLCEDATYKEWCDLYVLPERFKGTGAYEEKRTTAIKAAHTILVRNKVIHTSVIFEVPV